MNRKQQERVNLLLKKIEQAKKLSAMRVTLLDDDYELVFNHLHPTHVKMGYRIPNGFHHLDVWVQSKSVAERNLNWHA